MTIARMKAEVLEYGAYSTAEVEKMITGEIMLAWLELPKNQ